MKKFCIAVLIFICAVGMVACENQNSSQYTTLVTESIEEGTLQKEEKIWSEQEIIDMFYRAHGQENKYEYIACTLISDHASDRIGAVLFKDTEDGTTKVAFFDERGYSAQCGIHAEVADDTDLTYMGDGAVTFKLKTDEQFIYNCTISILVDDNRTSFEIMDDLQK